MVVFSLQGFPEYFITVMSLNFMISTVRTATMTSLLTMSDGLTDIPLLKVTEDQYCNNKIILVEFVKDRIRNN